MDFKSLFDSLDKATDILNVGRLIFYTSAGFCGILPVGMTLRMLAQGRLVPYWQQFLADVKACSDHWVVWFAALVLGFVIAAVAYALTSFKPAPREQIDPESYDYQYPRLFSGGIKDPQKAAPKDYAAWLISEYYRYLEIVWFIPYAILLSLPVYALYSLLYLFRTIGGGEVTQFNAGHLAFVVWTIASVVAWSIVWPRFWLPRIMQPVYESWVTARRAAIAGLKDFMDSPKASAVNAAREITAPQKEGS